MEFLNKGEFLTQTSANMRSELQYFDKRICDTDKAKSVIAKCYKYLQKLEKKLAKIEEAK